MDLEWAPSLGRNTVTIVTAGVSFDAWSRGSLGQRGQSESNVGATRRLTGPFVPIPRYCPPRQKERAEGGVRCPRCELWFIVTIVCGLPHKITRVIFCVFLETDFVIYKRKMSLLFQDNDVDVAETELKEDDTPPSPKSAAKEESDDSNRDKEESGDEDEGANDAGGNRDVEMASQNPDENSGSEEPTEEKDEGGNESQGKDEDKGLEKNEKDEAKSDGGDKDDGGDKAEAGQPAPSKMADDNAAAASTVEMEAFSVPAEELLEYILQTLQPLSGLLIVPVSLSAWSRHRSDTLYYRHTLSLYGAFTDVALCVCTSVITPLFSQVEVCITVKPFSHTK
ncbi:hypothetical protein D4764_11G0008130 [Takifugu flavidus]|uniref:Uncharacterized protein n=1 Tax=Takifugu flavidus TaxID=433684 RepID=A0A5C6PG36_9TELE|nr:hypothetical protein D4764_11G0008130 [Takifugu flavidus]